MKENNENNLFNDLSNQKEENESTCHHVLLTLAKESNVATKQRNIWKTNVISGETCTHEESEVSKD